MSNRFSPDAPVLVIGAAGVDVVGRLAAAPRPGTTAPAQIRFSFGGVARNVAENLARLGQPVNLITAVGEDRFGSELLNQAAQAGVNVDACACDSDYSTGSYLAFLESQGGLQYGLYDMNVIRTLTPDYLLEHDTLFDEAALLFLDANLPEDTLDMAMLMAQRVELPVFADPTSIALAPRFKAYLPELYLLSPNSAEAAVYGHKPFDVADQAQAINAAKHIVSHGVEVALITLAEAGVCYATSETSGYIRAIRTDVADPTGAGDALSAAVIFALLNEIPLDDAVRLGVAAASLTLRHPGAVVPDLSLEKLYDQL